MLSSLTLFNIILKHAFGLECIGWKPMLNFLGMLDQLMVWAVNANETGGYECYMEYRPTPTYKS